MQEGIVEIAPGADQERPLDQTLRAKLTERSLIEEVVALCALRRRAINIFPDRGSRATVLSEYFCFVETFDYRRHMLAEVVRNLPGASVHRMALLEDRIPAYASVTYRDSGLLFRREEDVERVPVARLDDLGWDDIDLVVVSRGADLVPALQGAKRTLEIQRPTLLVFAQAQTSESMAGMVRMFDHLFARGYVIAATFDQAFVLHAPDRAVGKQLHPPSMIKVSGLDKKDQIMLLDAPDEDMVAGAASDYGLIGRTLVPARIVRLQTAGGVRRFARVELAKSVKTDGFVGLRLSNRKLLQFPLQQATISIDDLISQVSVQVDASGLSIGFPPHLAALVTDYKAVLEYGDGDVSLIAHGYLDQQALVDDIRLRWPLSAIRARKATVRVDIMMAGRHLGTRTADIDFAQKHISSETVNCYLNHGGGGNPAVSALASSLGCRIFFAEDGFRPGVSLVWGVLRGSKTIIDEAKRRGSIFYYMDHAYFNRGHGKAYRITRDRFEAGPTRECPDDRLRALGLEVAPWQAEGRFIVVCPPTNYFMEAHGCHDWLEVTLRTMRQHTDREIVIREKPVDGQLQPLAEALRDAHALVTHSSNVAVEAVMLGTPVFVSDTSAARPVGLSDISRIESPIRPEREPWLAHLAYSQFSFEELQSGACWHLLQEFEGRPFVSMETEPEKESGSVRS